MTNTELKEYVCEKLKHYRKEAKLSQLEAAKMINSNSSHLTYLEKGYGMPSVYVLQKLCEVYKIKSSDLLPF